MQSLAAPYYQLVNGKNNSKFDLLDSGIVCVQNKRQLSDKYRVITTLNWIKFL